MYFAGRLDSKTDSPVFDSKLKLSVLNKIIESESATTPTLLAARSMCKESDVAGKCDVDRFNQKLFIQDPENLNIYFNELNQAVKDADVELIAVILRQMSQAKYSRSLSPISAEFITAVDAYIQENPFAEATILASLEGLLGDRTEVDVNSLMKQSMLQMFYIINFSNIPALQPLIVACEQFQQDAQYCQSIANTLRNRSDTNVMVMMGYGLDEKVSEIFGDAESLTKSQAAQQAFTDYQMCLLQNHALIDDPLYMFDPGFVTIMIQGQHEGANLELGALYFYDKLKDSGHEGVVDPRTCGLRYVEVN
ncbi:hypothetical protein MNBD_GAMMA02-1767 [hydrothermal vent metagenome]|uniref:Uncharacterized protein n=1 Tax=hydrothermal vent metagenome TaxID=652676 RepID=A0A3B0VRC0_9ZZZZ